MHWRHRSRKLVSRHGEGLHRGSERTLVLGVRRLAHKVVERIDNGGEAPLEPELVVEVVHEPEGCVELLRGHMERAL